MGFEILGSAEARQPNPITLLEMARDIMRSNGMLATTSIENDQSKHAMVAASSINRALSRIWSAAHWDWRIKWIGLAVEDVTFMYELPADYEWHLTGPLNSDSQCALRHVEYERLIESYPNLQYATKEYLVGISVNQSAKYQANVTDRHLMGVPEYWGVRGNNLFLFPVPDRLQFKSIEFFEQWKMQTFGYYTAYKKIINSNDLIPVPANLNDVVFFLANAYFKQAFEYPDFGVDEQRGEALLRLAVNRARKVHPASAYSNFTNHVTPWGSYYGS